MVASGFRFQEARHCLRIVPEGVTLCPEALPSLCGELVESSSSILVGTPPGGGHGALTLEAMEGLVQGGIFERHPVPALLLDPTGDGEPVSGPLKESSQDQEVYGSPKEVVGGDFRHDGISAALGGAFINVKNLH
jgi:hypothetical protein